MGHILNELMDKKIVFGGRIIHNTKKVEVEITSKGYEFFEKFIEPLERLVTTARKDRLIEEEEFNVYAKKAMKKYLNDLNEEE